METPPRWHATIKIFQNIFIFVSGKNETKNLVPFDLKLEMPFLETYRNKSSEDFAALSMLIVRAVSHIGWLILLSDQKLCRNIF